MDITKHKLLLEKARFKHKIFTIVFCLAVALVFWIFNALSHDNSTIIDYPVVMHLDEKAYIYKPPLEKTVKVAVSGYGWTLLSRSLGFKNDPVFLYPSMVTNQKISSNDNIYPLIKEKINDIKVLQIIDDSVKFDFEKRKTKHVYLKLDRSKLSLPSKINIDGNISIDPAFIICNGGEKSINKLPDSIYFSLPNQFIEKDFNDFVDINYHPSSDISLAYNSVKVSFQISK